ncbi:MAG: N-acetylglucosamine kinase [Pirellulaceae bacterium]|nr:MAG: N-acetylglucosamine kinase [Pirellulaceae bacterium]GIW94869.1 MAG: N-acetylglucosamine kinase [Pirellulaceae bacterium]
MWYYGIDCGGTKSLAVVGQRRRNQLVIAATARRLGSANPTEVGPEKAVGNAMVALERACRKARVELHQLQAGCMAMAGAGRPKIRRDVYRCLPEPLRQVPCYLVHDGWAALCAACQPPVGIALICGTGSLAFGRTADGRTARMGGWGPLVGDEGSGYWMGRQALAAAARGAEGRSTTRMLPALLDLTGYKSWDAFIEALYQRSDPRSYVAGLARIVLQLARSDAHAYRIASTAAQELAQLVAALADQLKMNPSEVPLVLTGGVIERSAIMRSLIKNSLRQMDRAFRDFRVVRRPAEGALALAGHARQWLPAEEIDSLRISDGPDK